ncbi:hypothetical protein EJ02DRAFT_12225 [Clathrospora elynae]|uniref:Uncharacterized protein n=1 Tax=Clathrospora elynae TaxID=706981 RepID=A0A6A5T7B4_9PLEO|nr:hypothetical protein EJ02DRAFT_12225 [Clathrospora elynae]
MQIQTALSASTITLSALGLQRPSMRDTRTTAPADTPFIYESQHRHVFWPACVDVSQPWAPTGRPGIVDIHGWLPLTTQHTRRDERDAGSAV